MQQTLYPDIANAQHGAPPVYSHPPQTGNHPVPPQFAIMPPQHQIPFHAAHQPFVGQPPPPMNQVQQVVRPQWTHNNALGRASVFIAIWQIIQLAGITGYTSILLASLSIFSIYTIFVLFILLFVAGAAPLVNLISTIVAASKKDQLDVLVKALVAMVASASIIIFRDIVCLFVSLFGGIVVFIPTMLCLVGDVVVLVLSSMLMNLQVNHLLSPTVPAMENQVMPPMSAQFEQGSQEQYV